MNSLGKGLLISAVISAAAYFVSWVMFKDHQQDTLSVTVTQHLECVTGQSSPLKDTVSFDAKAIDSDENVILELRRQNRYHVVHNPYFNLKLQNSDVRRIQYDVERGGWRLSTGQVLSGYPCLLTESVEIK